MFVNFSNHPSDKWNDSQKREAGIWGEIIDIPFPGVEAGMDEEGIAKLAVESVDRILSYKPDIVMCQGEFTLCFAVVKMLNEKGIRTVAACSERKVKEFLQEDGTYKKELYFTFERFRQYI